jgi:hypothetical protein
MQSILCAKSMRNVAQLATEEEPVDRPKPSKIQESSRKAD